MKKILSISLLLGALLVGILVGNNAFAAEEGKTLDVMFLHDVHSHINAFSTVEEGETQVLGGFAKIKTFGLFKRLKIN